MSETDDVTGKGLALSAKLTGAPLGTELRLTDREIDALSEYERRVLQTTARKYGWIAETREIGDYEGGHLHIYTRKYRRLA